MLFIRPKDFELIIDPTSDYNSALLAMAFAALKNAPTTIENVERTELLAAMDNFLASGRVKCTWLERSVIVDPSEKRPFQFEKKIRDYDMFKFAITLAATQQGSSISLITDIDDTAKMIILALRRMGADIEFTGGKKPRMVVKQPVQKEIKYHLKRESAKIVPQLVLAMAGLGKHSELNDLFADGRYDYIFSHFIGGFERKSLVEEEPTDELERRLRKKIKQASEFKSKLTVTGGVRDEESTISLKADTEFASYIVSGAAPHWRGKLILKGFSNSDLADSPLGQLRRMGVEFGNYDKDGIAGLEVSAKDLKARRVPYEQLADYPDSVGALALAASLSEGTSVIRSSPYNTTREEDRRKRLCEIMRSFGVKIAEIGDGFVVEGLRGLNGDKVAVHDDPYSALLGICSALGSVDQADIDDIQPAVSRWGSSIEQILKVFNLSPGDLSEPNTKLQEHPQS